MIFISDVGNGSIEKNLLKNNYNRLRKEKKNIFNLEILF